MTDQHPEPDGYRTVADLAYARLRQRILSGELAPGSRIDQDAEADRLGAQPHAGARGPATARIGGLG